MNQSEKYEIELQRFVNKYRDKNYSDMCFMTLEVKSSGISEFENRLKDALRDDVSKMSLGLLCSIDIVLSRLIDVNKLAKEELSVILHKVRDAQQKI